MTYLLWVVTNQWIFIEIGHEFVFKCGLLCDVMFEKIPDEGHATETSLLINSW